MTISKKSPLISKKGPIPAPLTPSFPVENKKGIQEVSGQSDNIIVDEYVKKAVRSILLSKVPKETPPNHMSVGGGSVSDQDFVLYQPHNYRLYFDYSKVNFVPPSAYETDVKRSVVVTYKLKNSTEHFFEGFEGCNITVKKNMLEVINKIEHKKWFRVSTAKAEDQIKEIIVNKDLECLKAVKRFCRVFGGKSKLHVLNRHSEDKIMLEDSIDKIPLKMAFHGDVVKKVYKEANVEFSDPAFAVTYLQNRALEKVAPEIAEKLDFLKNQLVVNKTDVETDVKRSVVTTNEILDILRVMADQNREVAQGLNAVVKIMQMQVPKNIEDQVVPIEKPDYFG